MAMQLGGGANDGPISDINTTPLIDVMLVLLIMLIITIPPVRHAVTLDAAQPPDPTYEVLPSGEPVRIMIDFDGTLSWNGAVIESFELERRLMVEGRRPFQVEMHVVPHRLANYGAVAAVMAGVQRNGLEKLVVLGGT